MTLEGRIVGVGMSKSLNVEYTFQTERIAGIQKVEDADREFVLEREKNEKKRYPLVKLAFSLEAKDAKRKGGTLGGVSDVFSIGYLLMEHKEKIRIQCELKKELSVFVGIVDSFYIGEKTGAKDSQLEGKREKKGGQK